MFLIRYTRYADDLTFSILAGGKFPNVAVINNIITEEGFFINKSKVKHFKRGMKQYVTGLTVTHGTMCQKKKEKRYLSTCIFAKNTGHLTI